MSKSIPFLISALFFIQAGMELINWPRPEMLSALELMPLEERKHLFRIIEDDKPKGEAWLVLTQAGEKGGYWQLRLGDYNTIFLVADEGAILIPRLDILTEGKRVVFQTPVPLLAAKLRAGETVEHRTRGRIYDLHSGEEIASGAVVSRLGPISRAVYASPAGDIQGYRVELSVRIDLTATNLTFRLVAGYQEGFGMVARRMEFTSETLGFFGSSHERTAILAPQ